MSNIIDIVMRSKNEGHYVRQTINAVRNQKGPWQPRITVIDSGSTDSSLEIFRELKVERQHEEGPGRDPQPPGD